VRMMTKFNEKIQTIVDNQSLGHIALYISCDAYGKRAEYIRNGMDFEYLMRNVDDYLEKFSHKSTITFIVTVNALSITSLRQLIDDFILKMGKKHNNDRYHISFDLPMLRFPNWQTIQILPERYRDILAADIDYFRSKVSTDFSDIQDFQVAKLERLLSWMKQGDELSPERIKRDRADFYKFFNEHDFRRETNFLETFPEMSDFWALCKDAADESN